MFVVHLGLQPQEMNYFSNKLEDTTQILLESDNPDEVLQYDDQVEVLSVFIHTQVSAELINKLPKLKLIVTRSTGFDHIDIHAAKTKNVSVCNVPAYGSNTVAEHTFALLLALSKRIPQLSERTKKLNFSFKDYLGFDLNHKKLGIIGAGKIGRNVIEIANGFDMNCIAHDVYQDSFMEEILKFKYVDLETLLTTSDIISIHAPVNDYTISILTRENISKIKQGTVFINTARGSLIKNEDLLFALENGIFSAVGLDAMDGEEQMFEGQIDDIQRKILEHPNVIYTPHSAFYTAEALERILAKTVEIIQKLGSNEPIPEVVN
jgi:D-lactate dehydrogenase